MVYFLLDQGVKKLRDAANLLVEALRDCIDFLGQGFLQLLNVQVLVFMDLLSNCFQLMFNVRVALRDCQS